MPRTDGGPAFPATLDESGIVLPGMTLRDYFAARALTGVINSESSAGTTLYSPSVVASQVYELADAMLKERER